MTEGVFDLTSKKRVDAETDYETIIAEMDALKIY
jgi:hypothetical protein